jgi:outer membrane protein TolC
MGTDYVRHTGTFQAVEGTILKPDRNSFMAGIGVNAIVNPVDAIYAPLAARQVTRSRAADRETTANNLVLAVSEAYFNVQQARGELAGAETTLRHAEELVRRTEKLAPNIAPPVEAVRARTEFARRKQAIALAYERWQISSAELVRILRLDPSSIIEPIEPPHVRVSLIADQPVDALIPIGLRNRPELASQQALIEATLQRLKQERMRPLLPSLVLRGPATNGPALFNAGVFGGGKESAGNYGFRGDVELQAVWEFQNLLFGNASKIRERRVDQEIAILQMFRLQDFVAAEIYQAHAQAQSAARRVVDAESGLKDAADSVDKNFQGLKQTRLAGDLLILIVRPQEVLASIQAQTQAFADYYAAVADFNRSQFRLYRALGYPAQAIMGNGSDCFLPPVVNEGIGINNR